MPVFELTDGQIDLWHVFTDQVCAPELLERYVELLSPEERHQEQRLRLDRVRHEFLVTRALVRTVLSGYLGQPPHSIAFSRSGYGKPAIACPDGGGLDFNLTHTRGLVVCAVTRGCAVGVDAEPLQRRSSHLELAARFFAPSEVAVLRAAPADQQQALFLRFWTLKESYIKAEGLGLSAPLDQFWFALADDLPAQISFASEGKLRPRPYQFAEICLAEHYQLAVAVPRPADHRLELKIARVVPLSEAVALEPLPSCPSRRWIVA
jgi:4'-phosphopantetheinyl transferase